ncbi:GGDEF domain-containing protein [Sphingomonas sp.]|uniref:GGDEF domain-containing protein n=1 Tax=Sphingomonas sp. TaxID=28214 RepID=UPI002DEA8688|nr:GGDEF domain-containing protein [Sphingomonas sp.]
MTTVDDADLERENAALRAYVAELEEKVERLERLADSDTLTPLANRRFFLRAVERAVAQLARHGTPAALLFIDLDRLKHINDAHGHGVGDEALIHTAWLLKEKVRSSDLVARLGGDEFGVLLEYADAAAAAEKAAALTEAVRSRPLHGRISIGISVGVTALGPTDTPEAALARADEAMYRAKRKLRSS